MSAAPAAAPTWDVLGLTQTGLVNTLVDLARRIAASPILAEVAADLTVASRADFKVTSLSAGAAVYLGRGRGYCDEGNHAYALLYSMVLRCCMWFDDKFPENREALGALGQRYSSLALGADASVASIGLQGDYEEACLARC
jgi:hypothetical protein